MTKKQKTMMTRLMISGVFLIAGVLMEGKVSWAWAPFVVSYLAAGYDIPLKALRNIKNGQVFDENFLMTIATFGAIAVGSLEEAVAVMLFYQVGELFSDYAVNKSRKSITDLMDINPEYANLLKDGKEEQVDPDDVEIDDIIVIKPGEKVPLDGVITRGASSLDTKALTGESMPVEVKEGMDIVSGSINLNGVLEVRVTKLFDDSTVAKILELVENASEKKAKAENFITKFARVYTPIVVGLALLLAIVPPLLTGQPWSVWVYRACSFLVVSCPCALVISVPLSFFGGLGAASKQGILMKGSNYLEAVANLDTVVFDKTGTLTTGKFQVAEVMLAGGSHNDGRQDQGISDHGTREELLKLAAYSEFHSNHPIALSVKEAYGKEVDQNLIESVEEIAGHGIHAVLKLEDGPADIYIGNEKLMAQQNVTIPKQDVKMGTTLHLAKDGSFMGTIIISDTIREDVPAAKRGQLIRIPSSRGESTRIELRSPDSAVNPYLALAACLAAGLDGIKKNMVPPEALSVNVSSMDEKEWKELGISQLPKTLGEAIEAFEGDEFLMGVLGNHIYTKYLEAKKEEWGEFRAQVTDWEIGEYLYKF